MKINEIIKTLQAYKKIYGDVECRFEYEDLNIHLASGIHKVDFVVLNKGKEDEKYVALLKCDYTTYYDED